MNRPYINFILICVYIWYIPTRGPFCLVSLTWVLRICWIRTNLEIHEHSKLYKLSPIQKHQETNLPLSLKWSMSTQGHHLNKAPGHGHTTTRYKFWQHFKAFVIPIILYQFQKDPFCLIILYGILFYFIHVYSVSSPNARWDNPWGQFCWWKQKGLITLITDCMFQKLTMLSDFMHTFSWFSTCI